jgi:DNA-binding CsgD family transcriptional regulator
VTQQKQVVGSGKLDFGHVHQLIRLLTEVREIPAERPERKQHLVAGVARILDAAVGGAVLGPDSMPEERGALSGASARASGGATLLPLAVADPAGSVFDAMLREMMRITPDQPGTAITATWSELVVGLQRRYGAPYAEQCRLPAGLKDAVLSSVRLRARSCVHGLALYRESAHRPFSEEERNLVHVFHIEYEGLLHASPCDGDDDAPMRAPLSPRQRQTLALVLDGLCDKEIAERLGISRYTVNQYTKVIYRYYAVTSRAQLLARVLVWSRSTRSLIIGTDILSAAL